MSGLEPIVVFPESGHLQALFFDSAMIRTCNRPYSFDRECGLVQDHFWHCDMSNVHKTCVCIYYMQNVPCYKVKAGV